MSRNFTAPALPATVWIVTFYGDNGDIYATFPSGGTSLTHVSFASSDANESYLTEFDIRGVRVWLQVEPGAASMTDLIDIVLNRYKHHPCVVGFGIDVEWLDTQAYPGGRRPTDQEASAWEERVRSHDSSYTLFLKHYSPNRMPLAYRGNILFVDDSQQFTSLTSCVNEFKTWGTTFAPNKVAFQFGYAADRPWWSTLTNPPATIGNAILANVPNTAGLFWVDFTITEVFPNSALAVSEPRVQPEQVHLEQNFPNPFNPRTKIQYAVPERVHVVVAVYNGLGQKIETLVDAEQSAGQHEVSFDATRHSSGVYLLQLRTGGLIQSRQMVLLK